MRAGRERFGRGCFHGLLLFPHSGSVKFGTRSSWAKCEKRLPSELAQNFLGEMDSTPVDVDKTTANDRIPNDAIALPSTA